MTDTATDTATDEAPAPTARARLAAAAAKRATKSTRRPTARKTVPRNVAAAKKGKYAARVSSAIHTGASLLSTVKPVHAAILHRQADVFAAALDEVAAEDARVAAFLDRVTGALGKGGAWGNLGMVTVQTAGAMMIAGGTVPTGPAGLALAFVAGELVQGAVNDAAVTIATREAGGGTPDPARVQQIAAGLLTPPAPPADAAGDELGDELPTPNIDAWV